VTGGLNGALGGEDPVVTVTVDAGGRENLGQAVQELEGREAQGGAAGEVGLWEEVEDLVGAVGDKVEAVEGEGRPSAVADERFQSGAVGGLHTDAGVQAAPTALIPGQHVLGLFELQQAVAAKVAEHPFSDGELEVLHEFGAEGGGLVEVEARCRIGRVLNRILLDPLEESVDGAEVVTEMRIENGAELMEETDGPD
jgi:hypothetical protein